MTGMYVGVRTLYANVYLLETPQGRLMVDAGAVTHLAGFLRLLRAFQPDALLLTHHHVDHTGGAFLAGRLGLPVLAHPLEHALLTGEEHRLPYPAGHPWAGRLISRLHPKVPAPALHPVFPGERVYGWEVIPLPGHTLGQIGLLHNGILLAGDALLGARDGAHLPRAVYNDDQRVAVRTLHDIAAMDLRAVLPGHGGPLTPEQVRQRARRQELESHREGCSSRDEQAQPRKLHLTQIESGSEGSRIRDSHLVASPTFRPVERLVCSSEQVACLLSRAERRYPQADRQGSAGNRSCRDR